MLSFWGSFVSFCRCFRPSGQQSMSIQVTRASLTLANKHHSKKTSRDPQAKSVGGYLGRPCFWALHGITPLFWKYKWIIINLIQVYEPASFCKGGWVAVAVILSGDRSGAVVIAVPKTVGLVWVPLHFDKLQMSMSPAQWGSAFWAVFLHRLYCADMFEIKEICSETPLILQSTAHSPGRKGVVQILALLSICQAVLCLRYVWALCEDLWLLLSVLWVKSKDLIYDKWLLRKWPLIITLISLPSFTNLISHIRHPTDKGSSAVEKSRAVFCRHSELAAVLTSYSTAVKAVMTEEWVF